MIRINLIPHEYIAKIDRKTVIAKAVLAVLLALGIITLVSILQSTRAVTVRSVLSKREVELRSMQPDLDKVAAIEAEIAEVERYLAAINSIDKGRFIYPKFLKESSDELLSTIWFDSIKTVSSGDAMTVTFFVRSRSAHDLAYWLNMFEADSDYSDPELGTVTASEDQNGKMFITQLTAKYTQTKI